MEFIYMNEDAIEKLLKCQICFKPFIDPVITRDGDEFCRLCITQKILNDNPPKLNRQSSFLDGLVSLDSKIILHMLDNLLVRCPDCDTIDILRKDLPQHLRTQCSKRIVLCKASDLKCPWSGTHNEYDDHVNKCIFQSLRPILSETLQCQIQLKQYQTFYNDQHNEIKELKQYQTFYNDQQNEIKELKQYQTFYNDQQNEVKELKQRIDQYENQMETLQKGFQAFLQLGTQQKLRYDKIQSDIQEIQEHFRIQHLRQNEIRDELQQIKEQYNQIYVISLKCQNEIQQSKKELPNQTQLQQLDQLKNDIQQMKEKFNQYQLEIEKFQQQDSNYECQMKQLQKQDLHRKNEIIHIRQICDQHDVQIHLLARKKCVVPKSPVISDARIGELIETFKSDSEIDLDGKNFDNQDMELICKTAIVKKQCQKLRLENNDITAKGITILANTLYGNTSLVELHLSNNSISDMGVHALAQVLSVNNCTLEWLEIHSNNITDEGAEYLAEMLKTNKTLILLGLSFNQISDRGVRLLASAMTCSNETLQWLHLASNKLITDASVDNLIEMLKYNRSLQALWLNDCSLSKNGTNKLKQAVESNRNFILEV